MVVHLAAPLHVGLISRDGRFHLSATASVFRRSQSVCSRAAPETPRMRTFVNVEAAKRGTRARSVRWVTVETPTGVLVSRKRLYADAQPSRWEPPSYADW
jgi:hypothetical protein